jgi:hypothetical protein
VAALEDKIVQRATVAVLNCIYEEEFLGFSKERLHMPGSQTTPGRPGARALARPAVLPSAI